METWQIVALVLAVLAVVAAGWYAMRPRPLLPPGIPEETPLPGLPPAVEKFAAALGRTREAFLSIFAREKVDDSAFVDLEEALIRADVGARASARLIEELRERVPQGSAPSALRDALRELVRGRLERLPTALATAPSAPLVLLVVGVNGSGKTTSIGKMAARYRREGKSVVLGAADTFRAGAIEQLKVWAERAEVPVIAHQEGADPAAVCHDTLQSAVARGTDVAILDTAGRLQAQKALMDELAKIRRVIAKVVPGAPHETLLVLDATTGQNAFSQLRLFHEAVGLTGLVLTKLDGTARGGVVLGLAREFPVPVKLVGIGEKVEDLQDFDPDAFVEALYAPAPG